MSSIHIADRDEQIERCFSVMVQLRPHLKPEAFVETVRRQQAGGYRLAYLEDAGTGNAVAGFRVNECLSRGKFMYVDDLVTDAPERSKGYGDQLFDWLVDRARSEKCDQFHLDSGVTLFGAHRFYLRKRMDILSHHFAMKLDA